MPRKRPGSFILRVKVDPITEASLPLFRRSRGRKFRGGIGLFLVIVFQHNEDPATPPSKKLTDEQILELLDREYGDRPRVQRLMRGEITVGKLRDEYNRGKYSRGGRTKPAVRSRRYGPDGQPIKVGRFGCPNKPKIKTKSEEVGHDEQPHVQDVGGVEEAGLCGPSCGEVGGPSQEAG